MGFCLLSQDKAEVQKILLNLMTLVCNPLFGYFSVWSKGSRVLAVIPEYTPNQAENLGVIHYDGTHGAVSLGHTTHESRTTHHTSYDLINIINKKNYRL